MTPPLRPPTRALAYLTAARLVVNTGQRFVYPFLPTIARGLGISLQQAGLLLSVRALAALATPGVVAVAGRGERRRRLMAAGLAAFAIAMAGIATLEAYGAALAGFALLGLAKPSFDVAAQSFLADHTPYRSRARYLSITELTWALSLLVGAPATGWIIARWDWRAPFWALACVGALTLFGLPWAVAREAPPQQAARARLRPDRDALGLLVVMGAFTFAAEVTFVIFGAWLEESFGLSLLALGGAAAVVGVAELAGESGTLAFADRLGKRRTVALGLLVATIGFALMPLAGALATGLAALALALVGFELAIVSSIPLASEIAPEARGRFLALVMVAFSLARSAAAGVGPWLFGTLGLAGNAWTSALVNVLALGLLLALVRRR